MSNKKKVSKKDKKDWEDFIKNPSKVFDKEIVSKEKKFLSLYKFDLHGYSIENANKKVLEIIEKCYSEGKSEILIITGKGYHSNVDEDVYVSKDYSTLRGTVPDFIKNNPDLNSKVLQIKEAEEKMGGKGAFLIKLKNLKNKFR